MVIEDVHRRRRGRRRRLRRQVRTLAVVLLVMVFVLVVINSLGSDHTAKGAGKGKGKNTTTTLALGAPRADVYLTQCTNHDYASLANIIIKNHTAEQWNYVVKILFADGKRLLGVGTGTWNFLAPGAVARPVITSLNTKVVRPAHLTCIIASVDRYH